ncbi:hypothetical protein EMEDMD4_790285 [Sinorhizobium medicae]|uniref:Uncharacterized protein n=1 Tax=Sinorhizobium medicae TaxID=110321 RepID=A0A508X6U2_9HYPH|nr:hypothetical protein EMEDMD4_790285 [Sinorhizobium medicae]
MVTRFVLPTMPPRSRMDAAFLLSHAAHCSRPTASIASCSALGRLRNEARSSGFMVYTARKRDIGALFVVVDGCQLTRCAAEVTRIVATNCEWEVR